MRFSRRDHAAAERGPVRRVVVLQEADAAGVDAEVADAPVVQVDDRVLAGRGVGAVVAEAVGERAVVAIRPAGAEEDDLARLELAVLGLPRLDEAGARSPGSAARLVVSPGAAASIRWRTSITAAGPMSWSSGSCSMVTPPNSVACGRPVSGAGVKCAGASMWVPV